MDRQLLQAPAMAPMGGASLAPAPAAGDSRGVSGTQPFIGGQCSNWKGAKTLDPMLPYPRNKPRNAYYSVQEACWQLLLAKPPHRSLRGPAVCCCDVHCVSSRQAAPL